MEDVGPLVEPCGYGTEAFEGVHGAFDFVPARVLVPVEAGGSATEASTALAVGPLVPALGDRVPDLPSPQVAAVAAGTVRLIGMCVGRLDRSAGARARRLGYTQRQECFDKTDAVQAPAMSAPVAVPCRDSSRSQSHLPIGQSLRALHESEDFGQGWGHGRLMGW